MQYSNVNIPATTIKRIGMDTQTTSMESLFERLKNYVENRIELLKLKAIDRSSSFASTLITYVVVSVFFVLFFMFLNIGLALLIGDLLGKGYYGFFIIAVFYVVVGIILLKFKDKWVKAPLINMLVKALHA